jgi:small-conductance mechanosensitive channel
MSTLTTASPISIADFTDLVPAIDWMKTGVSLAVLGVALALSLGAVPLVLRLAARWAVRSKSRIDDAALKHLRRPLRWLLPMLLLRATVPLTHMTHEQAASAQHALLIGVIFCITWLVWRLIVLSEELTAMYFDLSSADNLRARKVTTQLRGLRNVVGFLIWVLAAAVSLTTFEQVRQFGVTLLASAGIAGIIIGFAAQRSISTIIAGIQIALTQPIRVDDVVIVKGEWGRIEEITLTYVVVKIWDLRRLVVPINHFLEHPFENWTRTEADLLGTVFVEVDYGVDLDALRGELDRILDGNPLWDGKVKGIVVTEARTTGMQIRALMSSATSGASWDLRCEVREKLIRYLQQQQPEALPRARAELVAGTGAALRAASGDGVPRPEASAS